MIGKRAAVAAIAAGAIILTMSSPAHAQRVIVTDPVGDASQGGLDITKVRVANNDHAVVVKVTFDRVMRGDAVVSVKARSGPGVRIISERRPHRGDETYLLPGAFKAGHGLDCRGLSGSWDPDAETVRLRMPARCLGDGNYGAIRAVVLTEDGGGDVDFAPQKPSGEYDHTAWIPRG